MVIVRLKGGLGNQMFQYAFGCAVADARGEELKLDTSGLDSAAKVGDTARPFALDAFTITATVAPPEAAGQARYPYSFMSRLGEIVNTKLLRQFHTGFEPHMLKSSATYFDGYWQSPKYFEHIRDTLLNDFSLARSLSPTTATYQGTLSENAVSLHVRRGDYVSNPKVAKTYGSCSLSYYECAIAKINERIAAPQWFVFSDDIAWVKENLPLPTSAVFVTGTDITDAEELWLMSRCAHNVIANSSFSWWGAWLNDNPHKMVIAPDPWFDYAPRHTRDIIPDTWIKIPK